jgi:uncharacterized membrane protein
MCVRPLVPGAWCLVARLAGSRPWRSLRLGIGRVPVVSFERVRDELRSMFWLVPAACVVVAIGAAVGLVVLDQALGPVSTGVLFPGPPAGARSFLSSITQAMIAFTGLVFSITIVVLQLTSGQFSPRVLRAFLRDRGIQFALGVFISTFVYAMVVQRAVTGSVGHHAFVPRIAVTGAFILVLASVGLFIFYIHHVANMIRVATIVTNLGIESRELLERRYPAAQPPAGSAPHLGPAARTVAAPGAGVLVSVNEGALVRLACQAGCVVVLAARVGDFLPEGAPLAFLHPGGGTGPGIDEARLLAEVAQDTERTMEQDLAFGFRQLVDIAERALSPSTNDPTTACQALDMLHDLLRRLSARHLPSGRLSGPDGSLRLIVPQYSFADFADLAVQEIWRYGSDAAQVPGRITAMLADLSAAALPEHLPVLRRWAARIGGGADRRPPDAHALGAEGNAGTRPASPCLPLAQRTDEPGDGR